MGASKALRVAVHHPLALPREALAIALRAADDVMLVRTVDDVTEIATVCARERPDAVIIAGASADDTLRTVAHVKADAPLTRVVLVVGAMEAAAVSEAERSGVDHLVSAQFGLSAVFDALRGGRPGRARHVVQTAAETEHPRQAVLTNREREVLDLVAAGASRTTIAETLSISAKTVDNHRRSIMTKLGATTQAHAVSLAVHRGLLRRANSPRPA